MLEAIGREQADCMQAPNEEEALEGQLEYKRLIGSSIGSLKH
jgi:hypothetical protein